MLSAITISPLLNVSKPEINLRRVDFPHPEGPTKTTNSPLLISNSTLRITSVLPKDLFTPLNST